MHYTLNPNVSASCLYLPKLGEGRRLFSVKKAINAEERNIHLHVSQSHQRPWKTAIQTFSTFLPKIVPQRYQDLRKMQLYCGPSLPKIVRPKLVSFEVVNNGFFSTYLTFQSETLSKCLRSLPHHFCRRLLLCFAMYTFKNAIK